MKITTEDTMEVAKRIEKRLKELQILEKHHRKTKDIIQYEINQLLKLNEYEIDTLQKDVSHITTPNYLNDKYEVKWLINNTYQVEHNGNCVYQGSKSDCNEYLKCALGYPG